MDDSIFNRLPVELVEYWAEYLDGPELLAFRLTCSQANVLTFRAMAQCFFSSRRTSLMGDDLKQFEVVTEDETFRKYVKTIWLEDGFERSGPFPSPKTSNIWPRDRMSMIDSSTLGISNLRHMLINNILQPEEIRIRDYRDNFTSAGAEPAAKLAREITEGVDLAITSVQLNQINSVVAEVILRLSPRHQGKAMGFSLLHSAHLSRNIEVNTYWSDRAFYHAPALEDLCLSFIQLGRFQVIRDDDVQGALPNPPVKFSLKRLELSGRCFKGQHVLSTLENSWHTLTHISLHGCRMDSSLTWHEVLERISRQCPQLTSFGLKFLAFRYAQGTGNIDFSRLSSESFAEKYRPGLNMRVRGSASHNKRITWVTYEGAGACEVLGTLAGAIE